MCSVEQTSRPIVSPCSLPITMSSRQTRTSCSFVRNTSGPMKPATSLRCTHGRPGVPAFARASATVGLERPREAVLARLVDHHVEALAVAVGARRRPGRSRSTARSGPVRVRRVRAHLLDVDVEHGVGVGDAGEALEPERGRARELLLDLRPARRCAPARSAAARPRARRSRSTSRSASSIAATDRRRSTPGWCRARRRRRRTTSRRTPARRCPRDRRSASWAGCARPCSPWRRCSIRAAG